MAFIEEGLSEKEFQKRALEAGYFQGAHGYITRAESDKYLKNLALNRQLNPFRLESLGGDPTGLDRGALTTQLNAQWARDQPTQQMNYAIKRQEGLSGTGNLQQTQSMDQRNLATDEALANAKAAPGPGRSAYDQRLQQMMLGSFNSNDPSYKWRVEQGMTNLGRSQAAKGMLGSGNMAAELLSFGQGMASQEYGAQFNRLLQASTNATNQYTAAYSVLDRMLQQQQAQQNVGLQGEQMAQEWARVAQGWGNQNLGISGQDTNRFQALTNSNAQMQNQMLNREKFTADERRLDNWNRGEGQFLTQNAGRLAPQAAPVYQQPSAGYTQSGGYVGSNQNSGGSYQNSTASQMPSGPGYIINNSTGQTTNVGNYAPVYTGD